MIQPRTALLIALTALAPVTLVVAQTTPPQPDSTAPSAASSPSQRESTQTNSPEAATTNGTDPSSASSPHQQQATSGPTRTASKQAMHDCMAKQQQDNSGMSAADAKKACKAQMKPNSG